VSLLLSDLDSALDNIDIATSRMVVCEGNLVFNRSCFVQEVVREITSPGNSNVNSFASDPGVH
jgi:hypothetical protein